MSETLKTVVATALLNARGMRRGVPTISNILEAVPAPIRRDALDDAEVVLDELKKAGYLKEGE